MNPNSTQSHLTPRAVAGKRLRRRGLTLVEMLVATTVTLLLILGMAQAFAMIGTGMENRRSILQMSSQVRGVMVQLEEDLQGVTVPVRPWPNRGAGPGYLEIFEGIGNDAVPLPGFSEVSSLFGDVDDRLAFTTRRVGTPFLGQVLLPGPDGAWGRAGVDDDGNGITDTDLNEAGWPGSDDLATLESDVAEVIYNVVYEESDPQLDAVDQGAGPVFSRPEPGQGELSLHRRALLVRPDLAINTNQLVGSFLIPSGSSNDLRDASLHIRRFLAMSDMSVRLRIIGSGPYQIQVYANSLADLAQRENRYAHNPIIRRSRVGSYSTATYSLAPPALRAFPHQMEVDPLYGDPTRVSITSVDQRSMFPKRDSTDPIELLHFQHYGDEAGETIALSQVLGFDIRVFDALAQVRTSPGPDGRWGTSGLDDNNDGSVDNIYEAGAPASDDSEALTVQDPAIQKWLSNNSSATWAQLNAAFPIVGTGAYVDLGHARHIPLTSQVRAVLAVGVFPPPPASPILPTQFSKFPAAMPPTYDTWSYFYEQDGVDQNNGPIVDLSNNGLDDNDNGVIDDAGEASFRLIDEGQNGIDDDRRNGVDDPGERETAPPYAWPLRGLQVRVRVYDGKTRQVRQGTVAVDFIPE